MRFNVLILLFILCSCSKSKNFESVQIIGHGGNGLENLNSFYHDNTIEAIEMALSMDGCNGVELDVQLSSDGELWLYHDDFLESETNGQGCINDQTDAYLESISYKSIQKENLTKLSAVDLKLLKNKQLYLDLRHYNFCSKLLLNVNQVIQRLKELGFDHLTETDLYCVVSTNQWVQPLLNAGFKVMTTIYELVDFEEILQLYPEVTGAIVNNKSVNLQDVKLLEMKGKKVVIFEVRSPKGIRSALKKYPFGIMTDDVRTALIEKY
jgi:glycerophosphoryl diester phosphodiesterase